MLANYSFHKPQQLHDYFTPRIQALEQKTSEYINFLSTSTIKFPYSKMHDLYDEINLIQKEELKASLLERLNEQIIGRLCAYNPKLFELYSAIKKNIEELRNKENQESPILSF